VFAMSEAAAAELCPWSPMRPVAGEGTRMLPKGWKVYAVDFDSVYAAKFVAMGMGARARVLGPEELREDVSAELALVMRRK